MELRYFVSVYFVDGKHWEVGHATLDAANSYARGLSKMYHDRIDRITVREKVS